MNHYSDVLVLGNSVDQHGHQPLNDYGQFNFLFNDLAGLCVMQADGLLEAEPGQHKLSDKLEILKQLTQSMQKKSQEALLSSLIGFLYFTENHRILKRSSSSTCPKPYNPNRSSALCWSIPNAE